MRQDMEVPQKIEIQERSDKQQNYFYVFQHQKNQPKYTSNISNRNQQPSAQNRKKSFLGLAWLEECVRV